MPKICMRFVVSGRVQGVFYRSAAQQKAKQLHLTGWIRNDQNGSVAALACGEEENIKQFEKWLWQGPEYAEVESGKSAESAWEKHDDFIIEY